MRAAAAGRAVPPGLLLALLILAGCGESSTGQAGPPASAGGPPGAADPGLVHVHGLGVNPRDGGLYVATHTGLFVVRDGTASRVGDRYQDTMGFTVAGPDRFLGSGHPDLRDRELQAFGKPPLLGLVESRDAGRTWRSLSLLGEADFHALVAAHGRVWGADATSGRVLVSSDQHRWQVLASQPLASLAVSPIDPDVLLGVGEQGLVHSRDGGRGWQPLAGPPLVLVSWIDPAAAWGATADGQVYRSTDAGRSWSLAGKAGGQPAALLAAASGLYVALHDGRILRSADQARTWQVLLPAQQVP
jgi:hypothetical protein